MTINPWICKWCGQHNPETSKWCAACGRELKRFDDTRTNNGTPGTKSE